MKLVLSDRPMEILSNPEKGLHVVDLSALRIRHCIGCFGCWTRTPGRCVIRDDAVDVYPLIAASEKVIYVSRIRYGSYDTVMKTMLERAIPVQQAFIRLLNGETHHVQRRVVAKQAVILAYGNVTEEEKEIFRQLIERNAYNMNFQSYQIRFITEEEVEETVRKEVAQWGKF